MFSEEGGDKITAYGVLADVHEQRQNGGVPVHWDGRYSERAIAECIKREDVELPPTPGDRIYLAEARSDRPQPAARAVPDGNLRSQQPHDHHAAGSPSTSTGEATASITSGH